LNERIEIYQQSNAKSGHSGFFGSKSSKKQLDGSYVIVECDKENNKQEIHLEHLIKGQAKEQIIFKIDP
jgi:hypothetical protein